VIAAGSRDTSPMGEEGGADQRVFGGMAASLDGCVARFDGDLSWINDAMRAGEDYGFGEMMARTGAYVVGARTYGELKAWSSAASETPTYVVTHATTPDDLPPAVTYYSGDMRALVAEVKARTDKDICVFGGADVLTQFVDLDLLDELGVALVPVLLGDGLRLVGPLQETKRLTLTDCKRFESGIVILRYERA